MVDHTYKTYEKVPTAERTDEKLLLLNKSAPRLNFYNIKTGISARERCHSEWTTDVELIT